MRLQKKFNMINKKLVDTEVQNFIEDYQNKKIAWETKQKNAVAAD